MSEIFHYKKALNRTIAGDLELLANEKGVAVDVLIREIVEVWVAEHRLQLLEILAVHEAEIHRGQVLSYERLRRLVLQKSGVI